MAKNLGDLGVASEPGEIYDDRVHQLPAFKAFWSQFEVLFPEGEGWKLDRFYFDVSAEYVRTEGVSAGIEVRHTLYDLDAKMLLTAGAISFGAAYVINT